MNSPDCIEIIEARENNLKNISVKIPHNALTVITGLSGSGKSSLAFDTLYAEGQRRYVESMSAYARQFLERIPKPKVKSISGICPAIAIKQKSAPRNPRSTVGTVTEIQDFLRLLYGRFGEVRCRVCGKPVKKDSPAEAAAQIMNQYQKERIYLGFPFSGSVFDHGAESVPAIEGLTREGFTRLIFPEGDQIELIRIPDARLDDADYLRKGFVLVDRMSVSEDSLSRVTDSLETSFSSGDGRAVLFSADHPKAPSVNFSEKLECCGITYMAPEPRLFSFNNPYGACPRCNGFGDVTEIDPDLVIPDQNRSLREHAIEPFSKPSFKRLQNKLLEFSASHLIPVDIPVSELSPEQKDSIWKGGKGYPGIDGFFKYLNRKKYKVQFRVMLSRYRSYHRCPDCNGERIRPEGRDVQVGGKRLGELNRMPISELRKFFASLKMTEGDKSVETNLVGEISKRLDFLEATGLNYLSLERVTSTLSGGEMQRIHLAASLGSMLSGVLYVLDEPSIGLHPSDQAKLIDTLETLKSLDNTIVLVEHEREIIARADHIIDLGPGAGALGGELLYSGKLNDFKNCRKSLTASYLSGEKNIPLPASRRNPDPVPLTIRQAYRNNLRNITVEIPTGVMVCVTGVSGSGKSSLIHDVLYDSLQKLRQDSTALPVFCNSISGWEQFTHAVLVDQSPIGKTPRSNPVTYLKIFDQIRKLFGKLPAAAAKGFSASDFSFNQPGGRCEACQGSGLLTVDMQFLADVQLPCEYCRGTRYGEAILEVRYQGRNIAEVLDLTVDEAITFFRNEKTILRGLKVLKDVGLGYIKLGQSSTNLSGGEAQRIKLAGYLNTGNSGRNLFIFDEPTTGLHFEDIRKLLKSFNRLLENHASLIIIEHNLDVIKCADWIIDLGPGGGEKGGEVVEAGTPEQLASCLDSSTGKFLRQNPEITIRMGQAEAGSSLD